MRFCVPAALAALAVLLAGCGASHPVCKDQASAKSYFEAFTRDMIAAEKSGKLSADKADQLELESGRFSNGIGSTDWPALCTKLDTIRAKYGF